MRNCTIRVAKTKALICCAVTSAALFSHMLISGFLMTRLKYKHAGKKLELSENLTIAPLLSFFAV